MTCFKNKVVPFKGGELKIPDQLNCAWSSEANNYLDVTKTMSADEYRYHVAVTARLKLSFKKFGLHGSAGYLHDVFKQDIQRK